MSILSSHESSSHKAEADRICETIAANAGALRAVGCGKRFTLDGIRFRLFGAGRNVIYRLSAGSGWFLKMPCKDEADVVTREALGADACRQTLAGFAGYCHPDVLRVSSEHAYILATAVSGRTAQSPLYRASFSFSRLGQECIHQKFVVLGQSLATLHCASVTSGVALTRTAEMALNRALGELTCADKTCEMIAQANVAAGVENRAPRFAHGNFKLSNVLFSNDGVTIIDFENSGCGSGYEDVALLISQLICLENLSCMPGRVFRNARKAFLEGYGRQRSVDQAVLRALVAQRICEYYAREFCCRRKSPTIAGVPVSRRRARRLVRSMLNSDLVT